MRYGWVPPLGRHGSEYVHAANGYIMICAKKQEKILPAAVVNEQVEEKAIAISEAESRNVGRKERQTLKDEVIFSLLPKAFAKSSLDFAYIATQDNLIVVNAASAKRAEDLLSALREALGSLRAIPIAPQNIPTQVMTHWLRDAQLPTEFELGEECELQAGKDGRVIRCKNQDLHADEIRSHLDSGMFVNKVAITWKEAIHCVIDDQLAVKRLKFDDKIQEQTNDRNPESKAEQFDADFAIMTLELKVFISALLNAFGGEDDSYTDA
jgi:recombination associated protein RdgC